MEKISVFSEMLSIFLLMRRKMARNDQSKEEAKDFNRIEETFLECSVHIKETMFFLLALYYNDIHQHPANIMNSLPSLPHWPCSAPSRSPSPSHILPPPNCPSLNTQRSNHRHKYPSFPSSSTNNTLTRHKSLSISCDSAVIVLRELFLYTLQEEHLLLTGLKIVL